MPVYTPLPEHFGERRLAESLKALDDGKLHLWFDLALPGVANLDVVVWDEVVGVYVLETKALPIEALLHFDDTSVEIAERGWGQSPVSQARSACYSLKDYLRRTSVHHPMIASTVAWPRICRDEWLGHWDSNSFPTGYELSMVFADDVEGGLARFRERLMWIADHPLWGGTPTSGFVHQRNVFLAFANALRPRASVAQDKTVKHESPEPDASPDITVEIEEEPIDGNLVRIPGRPQEGSYREKLWLGTEHVVDAARAARDVLDQAAPLLGSDWSSPYIERIGEILRRLEQPFRLGVIGEFRAGKSSLVNALGDNRTLARISSMPGKTRLVLLFDVDGAFFLVDLPGYGYARVSQDQKKKFSALVEGYLHAPRDLRLAVHIVDIRHAPSDEDVLMRGWLVARGLTTVTVMTKADKLKRSEVAERVRSLRADLSLSDADAVVVFSAETRTGVDELRAMLEKGTRLPPA